MDKIVAGLIGEKSFTVDEDKTALKMGSGGLQVLGTPALAALMEGAAFELIEGLLTEGLSSVGTRLELEHLAATPLGISVTATAELLKIEGRKLIFSIEAHDERELVGKAVHERFIIQIDKFMFRANQKQSI